MTVVIANQIWPEISEALGISDMKDVTDLVLKIRSNQIVTVSITRAVSDVEVGAVASVLKRYDLVEREEKS